MLPDEGQCLSGREPFLRLLPARHERHESPERRAEADSRGHVVDPGAESRAGKQPERDPPGRASREHEPRGPDVEEDNARGQYAPDAQDFTRMPDIIGDRQEAGQSSCAPACPLLKGRYGRELPLSMSDMINQRPSPPLRSVSVNLPMSGSPFCLAKPPMM